MPRPGNPLYTPLKGELRREITLRGRKWILYLSQEDSTVSMGLRMKGKSVEDIVWFDLDEFVTTVERQMKQYKFYKSLTEEKA